jgi:hypothetical protein
MDEIYKEHSMKAGMNYRGTLWFSRKFETMQLCGCILKNINKNYIKNIIKKRAYFYQLTLTMMKKLNA